MMYKKAITTFEVLMWIPRILFLVIVMFSIIILVRSYVTTTIDISELQANTFAYRVLYSSNAISYIDSKIDRAYPGIIDINRFRSQITEKFLEKSFYYGEKNREIGAKFSLKDLSENNEIIIFYNEDFFKEQKKLVDSGFTKGPGGARSYIKKYNILILKSNNINRGILTMDITIPNS